jgi:hypothetical protein
MPHHQKAGEDPNVNMSIYNRSLENVAKLNYLGTARTNEHLIQGITFGECLLLSSQHFVFKHVI